MCTHNWWVDSSGVLLGGAKILLSKTRRSLFCTVTWCNSDHQRAVSWGRCLSSVWCAKNETRYNPIVIEILSAGYSSTGMTCTRYQRLRIVFLGMYWIKKIFSYNVVLSYSLEGVKDVADAGCSDFLIIDVLGGPCTYIKLFNWYIFWYYRVLRKL